MYLSNPALLTEEIYVPGLSRELVAETYGIPVKDVAKLGSAENPFGPSQKAVKAVNESLSRMDIYPNWTAEPLREKITEKYGFSRASYNERIIPYGAPVYSIFRDTSSTVNPPTH